MRTLGWMGLVYAVLLGFPNQANARYYDAGPVWNKQHAKLVCPNVCQQKRLFWDGDWINLILGRASVCGCRKSNPAQNASNRQACLRPGKRKTQPIYHKHHAKKICPRVCQKYRCRWDGYWQTTLFGTMYAVCGCK